MEIDSFLAFLIAAGCGLIRNQVQCQQPQLRLPQDNVILCDLSNNQTTNCFDNTIKFMVPEGNGIRLDSKFICHIRHMKWFNNDQQFDFFQREENTEPKYTPYWTESKKLNERVRANVVSVLGTNLVSHIECPASSMTGAQLTAMKNGHSLDSFWSAQGHPLHEGRTSVSGLLVEIMNSENSGTFAPQGKLLVHYNGACRFCRKPSQFSARTVDVLRAQSVLCGYAENSCEHRGECMRDKEIYTPLYYAPEDEMKKPTMNMFVCNAQYSRTRLYQPCTIQNGGCERGKVCQFNARTMQVSCLTVVSVN